MTFQMMKTNQFSKFKSEIKDKDKKKILANMEMKKMMQKWALMIQLAQMKRTKRRRRKTRRKAKNKRRRNQRTNMETKI